MSKPLAVSDPEHGTMEVVLLTHHSPTRTAKVDPRLFTQSINEKGRQSVRVSFTQVIPKSDEKAVLRSEEKVAPKPEEKKPKKKRVSRKIRFLLWFNTYRYVDSFVPCAIC